MNEDQMLMRPSLFTAHPDGVYRPLSEEHFTSLAAEYCRDFGHIARTFEFTPPYVIAKMSVEDFLMAMYSLGTPQEIQMVGSFAPPKDTATRTAHRDIDLPFHRDGIYVKALADMQGGQYVEKPNVDIVGLYCLRDNGGIGRCTTALSHDAQGQSLLTEVELHKGDALIWDNRLWHGRRGPVGERLLLRFWTTLNKATLPLP